MGVLVGLSKDLSRRLSTRCPYVSGSGEASGSEQIRRLMSAFQMRIGLRNSLEMPSTEADGDSSGG